MEHGDVGGAADVVGVWRVTNTRSTGPVEGLGETAPSAPRVRGAEPSVDDVPGSRSLGARQWTWSTRAERELTRHPVEELLTPGI